MTTEDGTPQAHDAKAQGTGKDFPESTQSDQAIRGGRSFISDGITLTLLEEVPWSNRHLRALLSLALADQSLAGEGAFAVVRSRMGEGYTAKRIRSLTPNVPIILRVTLCDEHWIAVGPAGSEPHEVFPDGSSRPWDGPVPVEALA